MEQFVCFIAKIRIAADQRADPKYTLHLYQTSQAEGTKVLYEQQGQGQ